LFDFYLSGFTEDFPLLIVARKPPRCKEFNICCSFSSRKCPELVRIILPKILFNPLALDDLFLSRLVVKDFLYIEYF
jgi:hypothetical protein